MWDEHDEREGLMETGQIGATSDSQYHDEQESSESFELVKSKPNDPQDDSERSQALMSNASARRSRLDIDSSPGNGSVRHPGDDDYELEPRTAHNSEDPVTRPKPRGLQAKSGIILVCCSRMCPIQDFTMTDCLFLFSDASSLLVSLRPRPRPLFVSRPDCAYHHIGHT